MGITELIFLLKTVNAALDLAERIGTANELSESELADYNATRTLIRRTLMERIKRKSYDAASTESD